MEKGVFINTKAAKFRKGITKDILLQARLKMNYWQVAAGDSNRDYSELFLRYGIMLIGPGDPGPYFENKDSYQKNRDIIAFSQEVQSGDIVILKKPMGTSWEAIAAGIVHEEYKHLDVFDDVEGWNLQHCRFVKWTRPHNPPFEINSLKRGTFIGIRIDSAKKKADELLQSGEKLSSEIIPKPTVMMSDEDLVDILIDHGLRIKDAEDLTQTILRVKRLVNWYNEKGTEISEHETRSFLILPLLLALGWAEQKLKIEWKNLDIAFFSQPYTKNSDPDDCIMILESKKFDEGFSSATKQAEKYAKDYPNCKRTIISDGCRYRLYKRRSNDWNYTAYLNILKPKRNHPYDINIRGAADVFLSLME
ncbi:MAG: hypothetical protein ACE5OZ_01325 [Candidatus Heimdallarchaeota archaeon]